MRRFDDENAEDRIVGEESFIAEDNIQTPSSQDAEFEAVESAAWENFHDENQRREELAKLWMQKNCSK